MPAAFYMCRWVRVVPQHKRRSAPQLLAARYALRQAVEQRNGEGEVILDGDVGLFLHNGLGVVAHADLSNAHHHKIVRTVTDGHGRTQRDPCCFSPFLERVCLRLRIDDRADRLAGELTVYHLKAVCAPEVEAKILCERVEYLVEPAGHHADLPPAGMHRGNELADAGGGADPPIRVFEHRICGARERRNALGEAFAEIELAAHCALGDGGDFGARARSVGEELNHLVLNGGRIAVKNNEWHNGHRHQSRDRLEVMTTVLQLTDASYIRNARPIIDQVTWQVDESDRWVILGPNGAGKSTILKLATANDFPSSGTVDVLGERLGRIDVFELRSRLGFVSSATARRIPATETVRDVVLTAAYSVEGRWNEEYDSIDVRQADRVLAEWDLLHLADRTFGTLSDGERKRALIARAVMTDPELLLLDEPSASLDLGARERLLQMLSGYAQSPYSPAMVMVTHHVEEIPAGFTHLMLVRDGRVQAAGPLAETLTAENLEATFGMSFELSQANGRYSAVATPLAG